jgi:hypothetical protein
LRYLPGVAKHPVLLQNATAMALSVDTNFSAGSIVGTIGQGHSINGPLEMWHEGNSYHRPDEIDV